jgi:hypothetical protein
MKTMCLLGGKGTPINKCALAFALLTNLIIGGVFAGAVEPEVQQHDYNWQDLRKT